MKCPYWSDRCEIAAHIPDECDGCSHGWLPFWSEAERAGLKAMGTEAKACKQTVDWFKKKGERKALNEVEREDEEFCRGRYAQSRISIYSYVRAVRAARAVEEKSDAR